MEQDYSKMDFKLGKELLSKNALSLINDNECTYLP